MGYQTQPTFDNPRGEIKKENTKTYKIPISLSKDIINQRMVIAVLSRKMFTTTKLKSVFESIFFKSKPADINNFYIKPTLEITYTASEYKKKKAMAELMEKIQKLQTQNNQDFRNIDGILNQNKSHAMNLAKKQRAYEDLEEQVAQKLKPRGKDIAIEKRINEGIFLMILGVWFAFVCFFNPKLMA
jgi:mevalonate kinase